MQLSDGNVEMAIQLYMENSNLGEGLSVEQQHLAFERSTTGNTNTATDAQATSPSRPFVVDPDDKDMMITDVDDYEDESMDLARRLQNEENARMPPSSSTTATASGDDGYRAPIAPRREVLFGDGTDDGGIDGADQFGMFGPGGIILFV